MITSNIRQQRSPSRQQSPIAPGTARCRTGAAATAAQQPVTLLLISKRRLQQHGPASPTATRTFLAITTAVATQIKAARSFQPANTDNNDATASPPAAGHTGAPRTTAGTTAATGAEQQRIRQSGTTVTSLRLTGSIKTVATGSTAASATAACRHSVIRTEAAGATTSVGRRTTRHAAIWITITDCQHVCLRTGIQCLCANDQPARRASQPFAFAGVLAKSRSQLGNRWRAIPIVGDISQRTDQWQGRAPAETTACYIQAMAIQL